MIAFFDFAYVLGINAFICCINTQSEAISAILKRPNAQIFLLGIEQQKYLALE